MKYLIPPSEGKSAINTTDIQFKNTDFVYKKQVLHIHKMLETIKTSDLKKIYGTNLEKAKTLHEINLNIKNEYCSYAIERYTGTVYSNIDWKSFNKKENDFFNNHFFIFSGLFGMVSPLTLIPNYKLKMNVLKLYKFWQPFLTESLDKIDYIIDLLPQIHKKAYLQNDKCINLEFIIEKNKKRIPAGHFGKVVKGKFIHFVCKNQLINLDDFKQFEFDGFKWDGKIFLKKI